MGSADHLRRQHVALLHSAKEMTRLLDAQHLAQSFTELRLKLSAFARKLTVHLDLESRLVCARLLRHSDPAIATKAKEHLDEMRALRDRLAHHTHRWLSTAASDENDANEFIDETKRIFELVSSRCDLEERELYPIVDRIGSRSGTWQFELGPHEG
jgi:hypothetical protein